MANSNSSNNAGRSATKSAKNAGFREKLGDRDIELDDFKVDELRKMASAFDISGSHDMSKETLVAAINAARRTDAM